jgi:hypothetical protein
LGETRTLPGLAWTRVENQRFIGLEEQLMVEEGFMNRIIRIGLSAASSLAFAGALGAQERDWDLRHHDRDDAVRADNWRARLFSQVRADLDHVQASTFPVSGDAYRLARTKQELNELQDKMVSGQYDERELDDVVGTLRRVVADNHLKPRDREMLSDDLKKLQDYRERHEGWNRDRH